MGKFKFTLVNLWFWASMVFTCFLVENTLHLTNHPKSGFDIPSLAVITLIAVGCLFMFFFVNHKKNKLKLDFVLLPTIAILGAAMLVSIWLAKDATYPIADSEEVINVTFSTYEKIRASIILVVFLAFTYGYMFVYHINKPKSRGLVWLTYVGIAIAAAGVIYSLIVERETYVEIFKAETEHPKAIVSFYWNKNYYGGVLLVGILSCFIANYYKPRLHWYLLSVVMYVALIVTAAVLPSVIATVALPVYLFEETIRFAIKKKWKYCIFSLISILILFALIITFYWGVKHEWDGFVGFDNYISEIFARKDFITFTGRTKIWQTILPYCYDNPLHLILGHGFLISDKYMLGITGAVNAGTVEGVRTTHNGYLQIFFEYGLVGFVLFCALVGYYIYAGIRLLLEKRFHFVFIHFFAAFACAVYNFCESSSIFDAGTKEMYITVLFIMPILSEYKFMKRQNKVQEIKEAKIEHEVNHIRLGQTIAMVFSLLIVAAASCLLSTYTFENNMLKYIVLNSLIGCAICLLFVPYLVSLYHKNSEKLHFVLHISFNGILIAAFLTLIYILFRSNASLKATLQYTIPGLLFLILLLETVSYSLLKNGSVREWVNVTVFGAFVYPCFGIFGGLLLPVISTLVVQGLGMNNMFIYVANLGLCLIGYFIGFYFFKVKKARELEESWNAFDMKRIQRMTVEGERYDG